MEGRSIQIHSRYVHGSLKFNYAFNSVLIIKLPKIYRRNHPLPRAFKSPHVSQKYLKVFSGSWNMPPRLWLDCSKDFYGWKLFHCHIVITVIFPIWVIPRRSYTALSHVSSYLSMAIKQILASSLFFRCGDWTAEWNAVVSKHFCSLANSN